MLQSHFRYNPPSALQSRITWAETTEDMVKNPLWETFPADDGGEWMVEAYRRGSLIIVHDGSYMPEQDDKRCSAAVIFLCRVTGKFASATYCELTDNRTASNYRGELIGAFMATPLLHALCRHTCQQTGATCRIYCDYLGLVTHCNHYTKLLT
jgi:hypothetical protein